VIGLGFKLFGTPTKLVLMQQKNGKSFVSELQYFVNIMTVMNNILIKKGINCLLSDGKSAAKSVYYLHSWSVNDRRHSLKLTLKFPFDAVGWVF